MLQTFRIALVPHEGTCSLLLSGESDMAVAPDILALGTVALDDPTTHTLLIDLAEVTFIDSSTIAVLVRLRNLAQGPDKKLLLVGPSPRLLRVLDLAGLRGVFDVV